jgi:hypothetical protein
MIRRDIRGGSSEHWRRCEAIDTASIRFELMINGESVLFGGMAIATMWKLSIITRRGENRYEQI